MPHNCPHNCINSAINLNIPEEVFLLTHKYPYQFMESKEWTNTNCDLLKSVLGYHHIIM